MKDIYQEADIDSHKLTITYDECLIDPREFHHTIWKLNLKHKKYDLPCEFELDQDTHIKELEHYKNRGYLIKTIYGYDHSRLVFSVNPFSCEFDSGIAGFAILSHETLNSEFNNNNMKKAYRVLENELETLSAYINGEVYNIIIENRLNDTTDSCGGFYLNGDDGNLKTILEHNFDIKGKVINELIKNLE